MKAQSSRFEARRGGLKDVVVVKLGGSHALEPHLTEWLAAIAAEAGAVVVAPGGGPFADAVRAAQAVMGFDDAAAHDMALMAMSQFGRALQGLDPRFRLAGSVASIRRTLNERAVPVWTPDSMARVARLPATWDLTSDSLAAWLARAVGARRLVLIKHGAFPIEGVAVGKLVADGVVDPLFPEYIGRSGLTVSLAGPSDAPLLARELRGKVFPEILAPVRVFEPAE
jgi:5-(aminomethyl)-3-furanmethanol phosphate kinase